MRVALTDYGVGNLHSIRKSLEENGARVDIVRDMGRLLDAECIVFPGVGAFDKTIEMLLPFRSEVRDHVLSGTPALGICIGEQIMFESSSEGTSPGLGIFPGEVRRLNLRMIPHMGWNSVETNDPIMDGISDRDFYFAHSYHSVTKDPSHSIGTTTCEDVTFSSLFRTANAYGAQFHPEKSGASGLRFIKNFIDFAEGCL